MLTTRHRSSVLRLVLTAALGLLLTWMLRPIAADRARPEFVPPGRHRVTVSIVDAVTAEPLAARIAFRDAQREYYPPLGHPRKIPSRRYGGDLSLPDGRSYAYVDGRLDVDLPAGPIEVEAVRGFEYNVHRSTFDPAKLEAGRLTVPLERWVDMEAEGWYPGDTHVHFPDPAASMLEMKGEGLRVTNVLALKSGVGDGERPGEGNFWNIEHFQGSLSRLSDSKHLLYVNEEFRNHFLGHLIFLNLKELVWPVSTGELPENGWGGFDLPTHADAAEMARRQGGLVLWAHFPYPNGECPVDVALGKIDGFDLMTTGDPFELHPTLQRIYKMYGPKIYEMAPIDIYYSYLNCGFRVTASAGSDKMSTTVPMGSARVYVKTGARLDYPSWIEGLRNGNTFISTGPVIEIDVAGRGPGEEIRLTKSDVNGGYRLEVLVKSASRMPYKKLEIIHNGKVIASGEPSGNRFRAEIRRSVEIERSGWLAARCYGREMLPYGGPPGHWFRMPVFAHTNPVYIEVEGRAGDPGNAPELFLDQIEHLKNYVLYRGNYPSDKAREQVLEQIERAAQVYRRLGSS